MKRVQCQDCMITYEVPDDHLMSADYLCPECNRKRAAQAIVEETVGMNKYTLHKYVWYVLLILIIYAAPWLMVLLTQITHK